MKQYQHLKTIIASFFIVAGLVQNSFAASTIVTDASGTQELWTFQSILNVERLLSKVNQTDGKGITQTWDVNGNKLTKTDAEGRITTYTYNATNQKTSMTEASGTVDARITSYEYVSPDIDLISKITEPSIVNGQFKETITVYDADLNISSVTINGFEPSGASVSRITQYTYNTNGQVTEIDGPRTDVNDISTITYYNCTTGGQCGQIASSTNALGHSVTYDQYDANGRLLQQTGANGTVTNFVYHPRGWLLSQTQTASNGEIRVTNNEYDNIGQLTKTTLPDGTEQNFVYDAAHDLREISDNLGNTIEYTYDTRGNRTESLIKDPDGTLVRSTISVFDMRNFVQSINNGGSITQLANDAVGNVNSQTDPNLNPTTDSSYDALNRLSNIVDALANNTDYQYNVADQLIQVNSPNGAITDYEYDDLGNQIKEISADRGTITYTHDTAGNVLSITDARSITTNYQYDELNRLTSATYPTGSENITYTYDTNCQYGIGRLCQVQDDSGINKYQYDAWGNITQSEKEERDDTDATIGTYITDYQYDQGDRIAQITYPGGRILDYTRDVIGRLIGVDSTDINSVTVPFITNRSYRADGFWTEQTYGNGLIQTRDYDQQGRLTSNVAGDYTRDYDFDNNGNILNANAPDNSYDVDYLYDALDRLIEESDTINTLLSGFDYDANGNRELLTENTQTSALHYTANSNRLETIDGNALNIDASGRTLSDTQGRSYTYNDAGRLRNLSVNGQLAGQYTYNNQQLRTQKVAGSETTVFHYNLSGNLIAESDGQGNVLQEYVYADGQAIAVISSAWEASPPVTISTIYDNDDPETSSNGTWALKTDAQTYGPDHRLGSKKATSWYRWEALMAPSDTEVYVRWADHNSYSSQALYTINIGSAFTDTVVKSHKTGGGQWTYLTGAVNDGLGPISVELSAASGKVSADAIRIDSILPSEPPVLTEIVGYIHTDHLGTPRSVSDDTQAAIWRWQSTSFGNTLANEDPDGNGNTFTLNSRFPGQYYDQESGLNYNWNRYYDPNTGRYITSDPIGLDGGINTYGYVNANPLLFSDPYGLNPVSAARAAMAAAMAAARAAKKAIEKAANYCKKIRCRIETHDPHHPFGWPLNRKECHVQLWCWRKGERKSKFLEIRVPYPCDWETPPGIPDKRRPPGRP